MALKITDTLEAMGSFPLIETTQIKGAPMVVADNTARDAIPSHLRIAGMEVKVTTTGKKYELVGGIENTNWEEVVTGGDVSRSKTSIPLISGKYIKVEDGTLATLASFSYSELITLNAGDSVEVIGKGSITGACANIAKYDSSGTFIEVIAVGDGEIKTYTYEATEKSYIKVSGLTEGLSANMFLSVDVLAIDKKAELAVIGQESTNIPLISGKYIKVEDGTLATATSFSYSELITLEAGESVEVIGKGGSNGLAANIAKYDSSGSYLYPIVIGGDTAKTYTYKATEKSYVKVCGVTEGLIAKKIHMTEAYQKAREFDVQVLKGMFNKIACIGDSLTRGHFPNYPDGEKNRDFSYPVAISRMTNMDVKNYGISGTTPTSWYTTHSETDFSSFDCAFICLGRHGGLESEEDKTNYQNIITKLKTDNPNMTIFLFSIPPSNHDWSVNGDRIIEINRIANTNNLPFIDIYHKSSVKDAKYRYPDGVHYRPLGYLLMAKDILNNVYAYMQDNESEFMDIYVPYTPS